MSLTGDSTLKRIRQLIESRGLGEPRSVNKNPWAGGPLSLHSAVRIALDMDPSDSVFAYWEWIQLRRALRLLWSAFDVSSSRLAGDSVQALVYSNLPGRTASDVLTVVEASTLSENFDVASATRRPPRNAKFRSGGSTPPGRTGTILLGDGTLRTSALVTIGVLKELEDLSYGDLFSELSKSGLGDEGLLESLDFRVLKQTKDFASLESPRSLVIARILAAAIDNESSQLESEGGRARSLSISEFFAMTEENANWGGMADLAVLERLMRLSRAGLSTLEVERGTSVAAEKEILKLRDSWS